ncbi:response regulator transcription factor [Candidatus Leptofilum sp.]|uniref:response regulator transcription factor n=1 Tax=Candidatus Leptofilum sp. TaxID=3241576 RepID=UPI003B5A3E57
MQGSHTILLIEDDTAVATSLKEALEAEGYAVTWTKLGREGLRIASEAQPHLIILDVRLPDGSGFDFCRQLRQQKLRQPILMLTAQQEEMDKVLGLEMGADDYVTKPFGVRELLSRLRALLRRAYGELAATTNANQLFVADLVIDLDRSLVLRGEAQLELTPTEFRLFVYLARHAGQALTRAQILQGAWGYDTAVEDARTVNVHIRRLREKVELTPSQPTLILTVPGVGYRLSN